MSMSSKKSNACYNRASTKNDTYVTIFEETGYSINDEMALIDDHGMDHHDCDYCNPPIGQLYHNRLVRTLRLLNVISPYMEEKSYYY